MLKLFVSPSSSSSAGVLTGRGSPLISSVSLPHSPHWPPAPPCNKQRVHGADLHSPLCEWMGAADASLTPRFNDMKANKICLDCSRLNIIVEYLFKSQTKLSVIHKNRFFQRWRRQWGLILQLHTTTAGVSSSMTLCHNSPCSENCRTFSYRFKPSLST